MKSIGGVTLFLLPHGSRKRRSLALVGFLGIFADLVGPQRRRVQCKLITAESFRRFHAIFLLTPIHTYKDIRMYEDTQGYMEI